MSLHGGREAQPSGRVLLAGERVASAVFHSVLAGTADAFPSDLGMVGMPADGKSFRDAYAELLPRFEAARLASRERGDIARHAVGELRQHLIWRDELGERPLHQALAEPAAPLSLRSHVFGGEPGWQPSLDYRGTGRGADRLAALGEDLVERGMMTSAAGKALAWVVDNVLQAGKLDLTGRKIAVIGAGAEMAPTRFWLEAGAEVLWLDVVPPPEAWADDRGMGGRVLWPTENVDLLARPKEVLATLVAFADGDPLDLGLYAYSPGQARELLLSGVMNALVETLPPDLVASVTILVSPTTPASLSVQDRSAMQERLEKRSAWEAGLARLGLLGRGSGCVVVGDGAATRTVVSIQGASYQAAQYLCKVLAAECWSRGGSPGSAAVTPLRVSANTAAITRTRSLDHPVFAAAFAGAGAFGVETFAPPLSSGINGLLSLRDWFHRDPPVPGAVRVHGGLHTLPYRLDSALQVAAVIGFARSPRLLRGLLAR